MIPYFESLTFSIGPIVFQTWGTFVALGFLAATAIAAKRAEKMKLNPKHVWDMAFWIFLAAMVGSRVFHVVFYEPAYYLANPLDAFNPLRPGFAVLGGFLGGAAAAFLVVRRKGLDFLAYADVLAWGLPWGCGIGRIGCFLIHDHPGTLTSFVGGVEYPDGTRHDLGLYLSVLGFSIGILFLLTSRYAIRGTRYESKGIWVALFMILYSIARFFLDFLRIGDTRWGILTPTQMVERMSVKPCQILGLEGGSLQRGKIADITIFDPNEEWTVDPDKFQSKSRNTPFGGVKLQGKPVATLLGGTVIRF